MQEEELSSATEDLDEDVYGESTVCTWSHIIDTLLRQFLTDDVLQESYDGVTRVKQSPDEDEAAFKIRLYKCSRRCRHVILKEDIVNFYVSGLKYSVRVLVSQHVRWMPMAYRTNLAAFKQAALYIGRTQRELMKEQSGLEEKVIPKTEKAPDSAK